MGVNKNILNLAVPSILANITVPIVGMVDIAIAGHLNASAGFPVATLIGGVAVGTMLFDLLYWNFGFLRSGTGGLTAQAYGKKDFREAANIFSRAAGIALVCAFCLIAIQWLFLKAAFLIVDCTPEVQELASRYFFIRIWAAPATLGLMAFKGWFIGMQDSVSAMITDLLVNGMNILMSFLLALGFSAGSFTFEGMGFAGIAAGTVVAQYSGLLCAVLLLAFRYMKTVFKGYRFSDFLAAFRGGETRRFFVTNSDLFVRSLCFIAIYIGFTSFSAHYGDLLLASSTIMMKIMMIFSFFTDGFAYAGEALVGRYIGERDCKTMKRTIRFVFIWSMSIGVVFTFIYAFAGMPIFSVMTADPAVLEVSRQYIPWLVLMPLVGCAAFTWDGIYVGATSTKAIRNASLWAVAGFFLTYFAGLAILEAAGAEEGFSAGAVHFLLAAYLIHLTARTVYLTLHYRRKIVEEPFRGII